MMTTTSASASSSDVHIVHLIRILTDADVRTERIKSASISISSSGFSRGASIYRGVARHHQHGRWQARIGRVTGNKDLYLGTFNWRDNCWHPTWVDNGCWSSWYGENRYSCANIKCSLS